MFRQRIYGPSSSKTASALVVTAIFSFSATYSLTGYAGNPAHPFSYEADGNCYCTEFVALSDIATMMLPTPIGGQTVKQICERLGNGPGLVLENGLYNHPAYADAQCGNNLNAENSEKSCTLLDAHGSSSCGKAGAKWDLKAAYAAPVESTEALQTNTVASNTSTTIPATLPNLASNETVSNSETTPKKPFDTNLADITPAKPDSMVDQRLVAVAQQLREFNAIADNNNNNNNNNKLLQSGIGNTAQAEPVMTIVESSFKADPLSGAQEDTAIANIPEVKGYTIRDAQPDIAYQTGIQLGMGNSESNNSTGGIISLETLETNLTQEDILGFPEIESHPLPDQIIVKSGDISVISDNATLEHRQIIIIEQDGSARRMTQDEIARLPLANLENTEISVTETAQSVAEEPVPAAAISNPDAIVSTRISNADNVSKPIEIWTSSQDYTYIGLAPTGYDFGGAGVEVEASASNNKGFSLIGSAGVADEYSEASLGLGFYFAPFQHRTTDIVVNVGVETGQFDLGITDLEDTGGFIGGYVRTRPISRLELTGGGRLSSYFEGDTVFIASGAYRITPRINAFSKVEVGDNDQFSLGFRYFY